MSLGYAIGEEIPSGAIAIAEVNLSHIKNNPAHADAAIQEIGKLGDTVFISYLPKIIIEVNRGGNDPDMVMAILACSSRLGTILIKSDFDAISGLVDKKNEDHVVYYNSMLKKQKYLDILSKSTP